MTIVHTKYDRAQMQVTAAPPPPNVMRRTSCVLYHPCLVELRRVHRVFGVYRPLVPQHNLDDMLFVYMFSCRSTFKEVVPRLLLVKFKKLPTLFVTTAAIETMLQ